MKKSNKEMQTVIQSIRRYPQAMKEMPFCCWKWENDPKRGKTKVPYNPKNGYRAKSSDISTFGSLRTALQAYARTNANCTGYAGIGIKISRNVGCIDLDHCIRDISDVPVLEDDNTYETQAVQDAVRMQADQSDAKKVHMDAALTDSAQQVLAILSHALVEYSPSGTGLHLYFIIPEGFTFDRDEYYINNRKVGMEVYIPGCTNRFLTVTGKVYRFGDMAVTDEQLVKFLDTFMKRPGMQTVSITPPEGGSILTDGEVIRKASEGRNGDRFMKLYCGEWETEGPADSINWSHSEADLSVCQRLAFYCRGDAEQIDNLFRKSGLMREKWDRPMGKSTYGDLTIAHAIAGCSAFYDPEHGRVSAEEEFSDIDNVPASEDADDAADGKDAEKTSSANIQVPIVDYRSQVNELLSNDLTTDKLLSDNALTACAWSYANDPVQYARFKLAIPKSLGVRTYEKALKQKLHQRPDLLPTEKESMEMKRHTQLLSLSNISTPGMLVPDNWIVNDKGIWHVENDGDVKVVSSEPLFVSAILENVDDGTEKIEITFHHTGGGNGTGSSYKKIIAPHSDMVNKNAIIAYRDFGLPVSSGNAINLTKYISEFEGINKRAIPMRRSVSRAGWISSGENRCAEFYPYYLHSQMAGQETEENSEGILESLHTSGDEEQWLNTAKKVRTMPFARAMLDASFASPLLVPLQHRNIFYHSWYSSRSGKTAALKFAMSIWGDPEKLCMSFFSTIVGLEHRAGMMCHLPLAIDELQAKDKYLSIDNIVYSLGNGQGKTRGRAGGGIRHTDKWHNCIITTGEQPLSTDKSMDGVDTRLLEVYGCPVPDEQLAIEMHQVSELNYGFAGEKYVRYIVEEVMDGGDTTQLHKDFADIRTTLELLFMDDGSDDNHSERENHKSASVSSTQIDNIAVLSLADYYSSLVVFGLSQKEAWNEAVELGQTIIGTEQQEDHTDTVDRAWNFVSGWVAGNKGKFSSETLCLIERYGIVEKGDVFVIAGVLNQVLENAGYSYRKCIRGFGERGYIKTQKDSQGKNRTQRVKCIDGISVRVYALNLKIEEEEKPVLSD